MASNLDNLTETQRITCPLCGRVLKWSNISLNKLEGRRVCGSCSGKLTKVFPGKFSFKDVSIAEAEKRIKIYNDNMRDYIPPAEQPKAQKIPKKAQCPKCHSTDIEPIGQKQKSFSVGKAAVGGALTLNPGVGIVTGMFGGNSKKVQFYCHNCGKIFKR